jgi:hypothetical protein
LHQKLENGAGMFSGVNPGRTQIRNQQLLPAKNIQRQKTIMIVIAVKKATHLVAMNQIIGGVKIKNDLRGRLLMGGDKLFYEDLCHLNQTMTGNAIFQAT